MPFSWRHFFLLVASPVAGAALVSSACRLPGRGTAQRCARALPIVAVEAGTVDLRRKRPEEPGRDAPSYVQDPRPGQGFDAAENWAGPPPAGSLGTLSSVPELNSAIAGGQGSSKLTVIKFFAPWCSSCKSIEPKYARTAKQQSENADFYVVDFSASKQFCKACGIKFMPVAHIYADGVLKEALPIGAKAYPKFTQQLNAAISTVQ